MLSSSLLVSLLSSLLIGFTIHSLKCKGYHSEHQYGFRPGHRTEQSVMQFLSRVYNGLNKETPEYAFFYLKKAFKLCF